MRQERCRIAALQGASSATIQGVLTDFAARLAGEGRKVAGVVEIAAADGAACGQLALRDLATGSVFSISQDLGSGSSACNMDPSGIAEACAAVERSIAAGADLVIISKFGKLEAERGGMRDAFAAAVAAGLPILTAVSPAVAQAWGVFAGPLSRFLPVDSTLVHAWWSDIHTAPDL